MGKTDGFLEYERADDCFRVPKERIQDTREIRIPLKESERRLQAARCMNCGVPYCQSAVEINGMITGCPLHNLIPEWNDEIWLGNDRHALARLLKTDPFPEFTSRVCPALCEKACINGLYGNPVTVHDNEFFLIEKAFENGWITPRIPKVRSDKRVVVIGSGPAGLAAADRLNQRGHHVTVFEKDDRCGGLLMYGIPNMKLDKSVVERRISLMKAEGVEFRTNVNAGVDITLDELKDQFDAIILACGSKQARRPAFDIANEDCIVIEAVDFLRQNTKHMFGEELKVNARGKHVVIIGGGDTGNDCTAVCIRQAAASVTQIEMMKRPPEERAENNPWPEWPRVLKTDYGQMEAIAVYGNDPRRFETTLTGLYKDENGNSMAQLAGVSFENGKMVIREEKDPIPCDLLIIAAGFIGFEHYIAEAFDIPVTKRGTALTVQGGYALPVPGCFACGDMRKGQSLVVHAINEGRECAREADLFLMGYTNLL